MDVLSDLLTTVRLQSAIHFCPELSAPWGINMLAQSDRAVFYVMSRGNCYLEMADLPKPISLVGGDLVMLPHGSAHILRDRLQTPTIPFAELFKGGCTGDPHKTLKHGGGGELTAIVSGYFKFENTMTSYFLSTLPPLIHICVEDGYIVPWLDMTLKFLASESTSEIPGTQIVLTRLTDVLFIQILRAHIASETKQGSNCKNRANLLRALVDPQMGKALQLIHQQPDHPWTVAKLAEQIGMSRTGFAVRFTKVAGIAPLDYVRKWRMLKASEWLRQGERSIDEIATQVGYESGAAFSKAFKRELGISPGFYRKESTSSVN